MCDCRSGDENHKNPLEEAQCTPSWKLVFPFRRLAVNGLRDRNALPRGREFTEVPKGTATCECGYSAGVGAT